MNKKEIQILNRIRECLTIPAFCGGGTQSTSIAGAIKFAQDCKESLPKIRMVLLTFVLGEQYDGEIEDDLKKIEDWRRKRVSEDWQ